MSGNVWLVKGASDLKRARLDRADKLLNAEIL